MRLRPVLELRRRRRARFDAARLEGLANEAVVVGAAHLAPGERVSFGGGLTHKLFGPRVPFELAAQANGNRHEMTDRGRTVPNLDVRNRIAP